MCERGFLSIFEKHKQHLLEANAKPELSSASCFGDTAREGKRERDREDEKKPREREKRREAPPPSPQREDCN